jgi:site-specific DNA-cytosine methylase
MNYQDQAILIKKIKEKHPDVSARPLNEFGAKYRYDIGVWLCCMDTSIYTQVPHRDKPASDGPRYKALGNSMAVPVMRWIGERIQMVTKSC